MHWHRFVPWRALPVLDAGQEYRLLMQLVLMSHISTGSSNKWFLWPGSLACFLIVNGATFQLSELCIVLLLRCHAVSSTFFSRWNKAITHVVWAVHG